MMCQICQADMSEFIDNTFDYICHFFSLILAGWNSLYHNVAKENQNIKFYIAIA